VADLDTLRVPIAEVADIGFIVPWVKCWYVPRACLNAQSATSACVPVDYNCGRFFVDRKGIDWTRLHAWVVVTLGAEMGYLNAWEWHKDPDPAGLGPHPPIVVYAAGEFTQPAASTPLVVSHNPDGITHFITRIPVIICYGNQ
jgi:hypothetical protein